MSTNTNTEHISAVSSGVGDAVGVDCRKWFVAIVNNNSEKAVQERMSSLDYETYVAKQVVFACLEERQKGQG